MEWFDFLGKPLAQVADKLRHSGRRHVFDPSEIDESVENRLTIEAVDESWLMTLGQDDQIEVIFLYPARGAKLPHALDPSWCRAQVRSLMGIPSRSGEPFTSLLGQTAAWDRFDGPRHSTHVEYRPDGPIAMVTLMAAEVVPGGT